MDITILCFSKGMPIKICYACPMKSLVIIFLAIFAMTSSALEVQCDIKGTDYQVILKDSPETGILYALLFSPDDLIDYTKLNITSLAWQYGQEGLNGISYFNSKDGFFLLIISEEENYGEFQLPFTRVQAIDYSFGQMENCLIIEEKLLSHQ